MMSSSDDRPRLWDDTVALTAVAAHLHAQRVAGYPAMIDAGKLSEADAADGIRAMAAIVLDWHRKLALQPPALNPADTDHYGWLARQPAPEPAEATNAEKIATLERAAARAAQLHERQPEGARDDYAACVTALLWWQQSRVPRAAASRLDDIIALNLRFRADRAHRLAA